MEEDFHKISVQPFLRRLKQYFVMYGSIHAMKATIYYKCWYITNDWGEKEVFPDNKDRTCALMRLKLRGACRPTLYTNAQTKWYPVRYFVLCWVVDSLMFLRYQRVEERMVIMCWLVSSFMDVLRFDKKNRKNVYRILQGDEYHERSINTMFISMHTCNTVCGSGWFSKLGVTLHLILSSTVFEVCIFLMNMK